MRKRFGLALLMLMTLSGGLAFAMCLAEPAANNGPAAVTGKYRNLFGEIGKTDAAIAEKIDSVWTQLFYGNKWNPLIHLNYNFVQVIEK